MDPDVSRSGDGKEEEETNEDERLEVAGSDGLGREDHSSDQLSLSRAEASSKNYSHASSIRS